MIKIIEKYFEFERLETNWATEIIAGVSVFLSLSYIFVVNPAILSQAGIPAGAVFFATAAAAGLATLAMGLYAKLPFALAPGLEANGFFAFVVVGTAGSGLGFTWQEALGLVFWSGVLCFLFTVIPLRQRIIDSIPTGLKVAISTTVGIFVAVIGLVVADLVKFENNLPVGFGDPLGEKAILLYIGLIVAFVLSLRVLRFPAGMLVSIVVCAVIGRLLGVPIDSPPAEPSDFFSALMQLELFSVFVNPQAWTVLLVFFLIDFYGSIGKFIGLTRQTSLQSDGKVFNMEQALYVDGVGTSFGSLLGTSTIITYVESAVGIGQGGRTGIVALICGVLMLVALAFSEVVEVVPVAATTGVLVYVGWILFPKDDLADAIRGRRQGVLDWFDFAISIVMACITAFTFSLDKSLLVGFWLYVLLGLIRNRTLDRYLAGSALALAVAMYVQYVGF